MAVDYGTIFSILSSLPGGNSSVNQGSGSWGADGSFTSGSSAGSLTPSKSTALDFSSLTPAAPVRPDYTPYKAETFDASVSGGPGSDLGWEWTRGIKSRQQHETEQQNQAAQHLQNYQIDLGNYEDAMYQQQQQLQNINNQLASQGLTPAANLGEAIFASEYLPQYNENSAIWNRYASMPGVEAGNMATWTPEMLQANQRNTEMRNQLGVSDATGAQFTGMYNVGKPTYERAAAEEQTAYERQMYEQELTRAAESEDYQRMYNVWTTLGYVPDETVGAVLGVPAGTKTSDQAYRDATVAIQQAQLALSRASAASKSSSDSGSSPSSTDYTNMRWVEDQARKLLEKEMSGENSNVPSRVWLGEGEPEQGKWTPNAIYEAYKRDLYRSLGYMGDVTK